MGDLIKIVAGIVLDKAGKTLLVRKRDTKSFMQPGGKLVDGEVLIDALHREISEELGCEIDPENIVYVGRFQAPAANEPNTTVEAEIFGCHLIGTPTPRSEIAEILWVEPEVSQEIPLAPLTYLFVLPRVQSVLSAINRANA